jgi:hypothetical protein
MQGRCHRRPIAELGFLLFYLVCILPVKSPRFAQNTSSTVSHAALSMYKIPLLGPAKKLCPSQHICDQFTVQCYSVTAATNWHASCLKLCSFKPLVHCTVRRLCRTPAFLRLQHSGVVTARAAKASAGHSCFVGYRGERNLTGWPSCSARLVVKRPRP